MKPDEIAREIYDRAVEIPEPFSSLSEREKQNARKLVTRFEEAEVDHGALPFHEILWPMLLSKCGRHEEAVAATEFQYEQNPDWDTAIAVANAARRSGDIERAAEMFAEAANYDPEDETCWLEVGDIRLEQDRFADALQAYENALAKDSEHPWALPSAFYCRHRLGIEGNWLASLREVGNQEGCTCGLEGCLTSIFGGYGSGDGIARAEYLLNKADREGIL